MFTSPVLSPKLRWDELVVSWNVEMPETARLMVEARAIWDDRASRFYCMGRWTAKAGWGQPGPTSAAADSRESVPDQKDADGRVTTDTLVLNRRCQKVQLRLTLDGSPDYESRLKFVGICLTDSLASFPALRPQSKAWGKILGVPERSQMAYPNGGVLCSPTTVSMLLAYWAGKCANPGLDKDVPEVAARVYDANWKGTGNWSFNMAYAGSLPGLRAYVTRLSDVSELESLIEAGIPVGLSVCYNRLRGKGVEANGHLVVCAGFTEKGDVVVNDPGTSQNIRKVFPRQNLVSAWAYSHNTVYLVYPEGTKLPKNRFGQW